MNNNAISIKEISLILSGRINRIQYLYNTGYITLNEMKQENEKAVEYFINLYNKENTEGGASNE